MSNLYTVTTLTTGTDYPYIVGHFDYQDEIDAEVSTRENEAMKKWHHESSYKRSFGGFFKCYIEDENGGVIVSDSSDVIGASESRLFSLIVTINGTESEPILDYNNFNSAMVAFHDVCESKRSNDEVDSYVIRIENEFGGKEIEEKYTKGE